MTNETNENGTNQTIVDYTAKLNELDNMSVGQLQRCVYEICGEVTTSRNKKSLKRRVARLLQNAIEEANAAISDEGIDTGFQEETSQDTCLIENESEVDSDFETDTPMERETVEIDDIDATEDTEVLEEEVVSNETSIEIQPEDNEAADATVGELNQEDETKTEDGAVVEQITESAVEHVIKVGTARPRDPRLPEPGTVIVKSHKGVDHEVTVLEKGFSYEGDHYRSLSALAKKISGTTWNGFTFFRLSKRVSHRAEEDAA